MLNSSLIELAVLFLGTPNVLQPSYMALTMIVAIPTGGSNINHHAMDPLHWQYKGTMADNSNTIRTGI